jgi:NAD(P)-dependent dehydrogenase (short-subunit alcohol dehydrogenase family)
VTGVGRVVVITGANRGLGLELARRCADRGDTVVLGSRDPAAGRAAAQLLRGAGHPGRSCLSRST